MSRVGGRIDNFMISSTITLNNTCCLHRHSTQIIENQAETIGELAENNGAADESESAPTTEDGGVL